MKDIPIGAGQNAEEQLIHSSTSLCRVCKNAVPARVMATPDGEVWMRKACDAHGAQQVRLSTSASWYKRMRRFTPKPQPPALVKNEVDHGCPFDCGPCANHIQKVRLPIVTITSACNLDCPICYVHNKNENPFHMSVEEFRTTLVHLQRDHGGQLDILNITGGEPTLHPHFLDCLRLVKEAGVHRVTICSNGIRLVRDESLAAQLAEIGARVALSFDSFDSRADFTLQGANLLQVKSRCLDILEQYNIDTTLIPVMTRGVNDHEIGDILRLAFAKRNVRHVEIHTMTYTGQSGVDFDRAGRISMVEVLERIEQTTGGLLRPSDFVPSPCAHPLCYQIAYLLVDPDGGDPIPFTRFMDAEEIYEALSDRLYLEPTPDLEQALQRAIDALWISEAPDSERALRLLKNLLLAMFPSERGLSHQEALQRAERAIKAVYVHSHMDEETFDTERVAACCDSNCYPDGSAIPVCSYNVLYRDKECHFVQTPQSWNERSGGQKSFPSPEGEPE